MLILREKRGVFFLMLVICLLHVCTRTGIGTERSCFLCLANFLNIILVLYRAILVPYNLGLIFVVLATITVANNIIVLTWLSAKIWEHGDIAKKVRWDKKTQADWFN